jgi:hypothetical protein
LLRDSVWGIVALWRMRLAVSPLGGWHRTTAIANSSSDPRKLQLPGRRRIPPCSFFTLCYPLHRYFPSSDSAQSLQSAQHHQSGLRSFALLMSPFVGLERPPNHRASPLSPTHRLGTSLPWFRAFFSTKSSVRCAGKEAALARHVEGWSAHAEGVARISAALRGWSNEYRFSCNPSLVTVYRTYDLRVSGIETCTFVRTRCKDPV